MDQSSSKRVNAFFILLILFMLVSMPLFAQQAVDNLTNVANTILGIFKSNLVKTILAIALCGSFIAFAVNKDSQRVKSAAIAVGISAAVIISVTYILDLVWTD